MRTHDQFAVLLAVCWLTGCTASDSRPYTAESVIQVQQAQRRTAPAATGAPVADIPTAGPAVIPAVEQSYPDHTEQWVHAVRDRGSEIQLADGSVWAIAQQHQPDTEVWLVAEAVVVTRHPDRRYPFKLTNRAKNSAVIARLVEPARTP